ncbi:MAG: penicillin acylase family protein [Bacteroidota bacterium]
MHTSTYADAVDQYLETVSRKGDKFYYKHDGKWKEIKEKSVSIKYKDR